MAIRVPRIMHAKQILRQSKLSANQAASTSTYVPKGHFAVYVGEMLEYEPKKYRKMQEEKKQKL